ncbi:MAG: membrane protein insertase YidC [Bdellovibrionota bacterium]
MSNEKRMLLAIALIMGVTYVWSKLFFPQAPVKTPAVAQEKIQELTSTSSSEPEQTSETAPSIVRQTLAPAFEEKVVEFETSYVDATLSSRAAALTHVGLKEYKTTIEKDAPGITVVPFSQGSNLPLNWNVTIGETTFSDQMLNYQLTEKTADRTTFRAQATPGVFVEKTWYVSTTKPYVFDVEFRILNQSLVDHPLKVSHTTYSKKDEQTKKPGIFSMFSAASRKLPTRIMAYVNEKEYHWSYKDIAEDDDTLLKGSISWLGLDSQYFVFAVLPTMGNWSSIQTQNKDEQSMIEAFYPERVLDSGKEQKFSLQVYAGPKDIELLQEMGSDLDHSIDYGIWGPIARPILSLLRWIHGYIPNYGWAIIILTLMVRGLMFPLVQKQARSTKKMQQHSPAMNALKEKYADDKEAYTRELMTYMRTHKINPMGGCLLLLPQMPIFFALYRVLYNAIELRHAPFALWITDLSSHDPYFVLPVLVGVTFFLQTKLNPMPAGDPAQQTMMKVMPVMFSVFMVFLPSGLNLYIFVSTVWGIVQQYIVQRKPV